jgi:hypothetical protein
MWKKGGELVNYVYHVDQPDIYGEDFSLKSKLKVNEWNRIKFVLTLNNPKIKNGILATSINDQLVFIKKDFNFRNIDSIKIDTLCFSVFYGGHTLDWAPSENQEMRIRNLLIR